MSLKRYLPVMFTFAAALWGSGCGGPPPEPAVVEIPGYEALQEQFSGRDLSPLRSRRIVLDPGHGGFFRGAVGAAGLTEAEVNLGVALYLRGLLEWSGAEVFMTRTADYDFLSPADSTLAGDLAFRVSFADSLQPDVFLSLHHNSVASLDRTVNETQTYYPLNADAASLDLARAIHRHLVLNLEITPAKILPGNFHVLRKATVPAVLGEPAMISHPVIEGRLSLAASHKLEAEAYFLGLLDYFSQGSPTWSGARTDSVVVGAGASQQDISWTFVSGDSLHEPGPGPDPGTITLTLNGRPTPFHVTEPFLTVRWAPAQPDLELPAVLELRGRNLLGRAAPVRRTVLLPPTAARVDLHFSSETAVEEGGAGLAIHWRVAGNSNLPAGQFVCADGRTLPVDGGSAGHALWPDNTTLPTEVWYHPDNTDLPRVPCDLVTTQLPAPWRWRLLETDQAPRSGAWSSRIFYPEGFPPGSADQTSPLIPYLPGQPLWLSAPGILPLIDPAPGVPDTARTVSAADRIWPGDLIVPALHGKIIVLDPAGGGSDTDGTGPLGMRGATLNLETALLAESLLAGCGAQVHLTRKGESLLAAEEKVRLAGDVGADLFLTIGRHLRAGTMTASHHPGSETGVLWADLFLQAASTLTGPADSLAVAPSYDYLLRHTSCPALEIRLPGPATPRQEMLMSGRGWQRAEARAILLSIVSVFQPDKQLAPTLDVAAVIAALDGGIALDDVDWAELDGNLTWSPLSGRAAGGPTSTAVDFSLGSGQGPGLPDLMDRHTLEIHSGPAWQMWLLEKSGRAITAKLMMRKP